MNYWALKQTTEKTHRALHKQMKAFQVCRGFFGGGGNGWWKGEVEDKSADKCFLFLVTQCDFPSNFLIGFAFY